jgi:hypothetical protein
LGVEDRATSRGLHGELSRELGVQTGGERESIDVDGDDGTRNNSTESDCTLRFDSGVRSEAHIWKRWALQGRRCEVHALVDVDGERERLIDVDRVEIVRNLLNLIHNLRHSLLNGILDLGEDVLDLAEEATACERVGVCRPGGTPGSGGRDGNRIIDGGTNDSEGYNAVAVIRSSVSGNPSQRKWKSSRRVGGIKGGVELQSHNDWFGPFSTSANELRDLVGDSLVV